MLDAVRRSGIDVVGDVPWGTHFCQFYQSSQDLIDTLVPYFRAGLEDGEYCMWVTSEPLLAAEARSALRAALPDLDEYSRRGQIEIVPYTEWYLIGGRFDSRRVLEGWVGRLEQAKARGFAGLRLTGNTFWLEKAGWRSFTEYEAQINDVIGKYEMMALCTYALDRCDAAEVIDVVRNHQFALIKQDGRWQLIESSERKRAAEERERILEELRRVNQGLRELEQAREESIRAIGHDLRSPLTAILGHAQLLPRLADRPDLVRQTGDLIVRNARRMNEMLSDLVDLARLEAGQYKLTPRPVDLSSAVLELKDRLGHAGGGSRVRVELAEPLPMVYADPGAVDRALSNLVGNALKYSEPDAPVTVSLARRDREVAVSVVDRGQGIPPHELEHLFERYHRVRATAEPHEGLGLGLYITKGLVEAQGGRVWVESVAGRGSTFGFTLPVAG